MSTRPLLSIVSLFVTCLLTVQPAVAQEADWLEMSAYLFTGQPPEVLRVIEATDASALTPAQQSELALGGAYFSLSLGQYDSARRHLDKARKLAGGLSGAQALSNRYLLISLDQALAHRLDPGKSRQLLRWHWDEARSALAEYKPSSDEGVVLHPHILGASFGLWLEQMVEAEIFLGAEQASLLEQVQSLGRSVALSSFQGEVSNPGVYLAYLEATSETVGGLSAGDPLAEKLSVEPDFARFRELAAGLSAVPVEGVTNLEVAGAFLDRITATHYLRELEKLNEKAAGRKFDDAESARVRELMGSLQDLVANGAHIGNAMRYYVVGCETALHSRKTGWESGIRKLLESFPESLSEYPSLHSRALVVRSTLRRLDGRAAEALVDAREALQVYREMARGGLDQGGLLRLRRQARPAFEAVVEASLAAEDVEGAFAAAWTYLALETQVSLPTENRELFLSQSSAQLARKLSSGQRFLLYFPGDTRLLMFAVDGKGLSWSSSDIGRLGLHDGQQQLRRALSRADGVRRLRGTPWEGASAAAKLLDAMPPGEFSELIVGAPGSLINCPWSYLLASSARLSGQPTAFRMSDLSGLPTKQPTVRGLRALGNPDGTLTAAEIEVKSLPELVPGATVAVGAQANREFLGDFEGGVLHLATHGTIDPRLPSASYLLLAGPDQLLAKEIAGLNLPKDRTDMVVLSACDSGSHILDEIGLRSLAGAFLQGGAGRVLGTLWPVNDEATSVLMRRFYQEVVAGKTPEQALLLAQTQLRNSETYSDPNLWAPFSLYSR